MSDFCSYYNGSRGGFYTQLVRRRIDYIESQLLKDPLLNRNRLIKCYSMVTSKYLLHLSCRNKLSYIKSSLAEPILARVGWKSVLSHRGIESPFPCLSETGEP